MEIRAEGRGDPFPVFSNDLSVPSSGRRYLGRRLHQASPTSRSRRGQPVGGWIGGHRSNGVCLGTHHRPCEHAGLGRLAGLRAAVRGVQLSDGGVAMGSTREPYVGPAMGSVEVLKTRSSSGSVRRSVTGSCPKACCKERYRERPASSATPDWLWPSTREAQHWRAAA